MTCACIKYLYLIHVLSICTVTSRLLALACALCDRREEALGRRLGLEVDRVFARPRPPAGPGERHGPERLGPEPLALPRGGRPRAHEEWPLPLPAGPGRLRGARREASGACGPTQAGRAHGQKSAAFALAASRRGRPERRGRRGGRARWGQCRAALCRPAGAPSRGPLARRQQRPLIRQELEEPDELQIETRCGPGRFPDDAQEARQHRRNLMRAKELWRAKACT